MGFRNIKNLANLYTKIRIIDIITKLKVKKTLIRKKG